MIEIIPNWHPIFVHFTVALLLVSISLHIALVFISGTLKDQWQIVARWTLWLGAGISILTLVAGLHAFSTVTHDDPSHLAMVEHRNWAFVTLAAFFSLAIWSIILFRANREVNKLFIALLAVAGLLLISTAWHGGELVYRHGLGVISLPKLDDHAHQLDSAQEDHGHGNKHSDESDHHEHDIGPHDH